MVLALLTVATVVAFQVNRDPRIGEALFHFDAVSRVASAGALAVLAALVAGAVVSVYEAGAACPAWPLCGPGLLPESPLGLLSLGHRVSAVTAGLLVFGGALLAWRLRNDAAPVMVSASLTAALFGGQVLIGAGNVLRAFPLHFSSLHAVTGLAIWVAVIAFAVLAMQYVRLSPLRSPARPLRGLRPALADYFALTKPIIALLLLTTTAAAMVVAGRGWPPLDLFLWTMLGGALASGGASALNQVIDRDLDRAMTRTSRRPLAQGRISFAAGLSFGLVLTLAAFYVLAVFVNVSAAGWAMIGSVYYVIAYSAFLKKSTPQNIVIGGGAGAIPPLVGWAAVAGEVSPPAWFLFALVFFWTPPHFWALSLLKKNDYARAGVPMLPVVAGEAETRRQIVLYALVMVALSLLLTPAGVAGLVYLIGAALLGLIFLAYAVWLWRAASNRAAWGLYKYSSLYLALTFAALVVDRFFFVAI
jgi:protoheme IX farnesyltransferase